MKILVVIPSLRGGGAERVVSLLSREWAKSHEVTIAVVPYGVLRIVYDYGGRIVDLRNPADAAEHSQHLHRKIHNVDMRSMPLLGLIRRRLPNVIKRAIYRAYYIGEYAYDMGVGAALLLSFLRRDRPHRIISFTEDANILAIITSALTGRLPRLTISVHGDPAKFPFRQRLMIPLLYRLPARVVAVSEGVRRGLASTCRLPPERTSFIPNPVVIRNARDAAGETAPPLPERYVLGVGRLVPMKGFERLLRAFHRLDRPALHLAIVGEGPERAALLRLARELGLEDRLHLPGFVADVETWYRHAACFVLSSGHGEGWPCVLGEALANGSPVVSFDCDYGPSEILEGGKYGLLAPEGDVEALAEAMARVLDDDALRRDLAAGGPERARAFSPEKVAPRWLEADAEREGA